MSAAVGLNDARDKIGQGAAYNPVSNSWRTISLSPLRARADATGVWTGRFFMIIGGLADGEYPIPGPGSAAHPPHHLTCGLPLARALPAFLAPP
jgi:hypothetical protein